MRSRLRVRITLLALALLVSGCADATLTRTGSISSYDHLRPADGLVAKALVHVDHARLKNVRSVHFGGLDYAPTAQTTGLSETERQLIRTALNRALCNQLAAHFTLAPTKAQADITIDGAITLAKPTDSVAASASAVTSVATTALLFAPLPARIPIGMGSLSLEAEARDTEGRQVAAMVWARGADAVTTRARASAAGDAYELSTRFASDFTALVVRGEAPDTVSLSGLMPTEAGLVYAIGGKPVTPACAVYGNGTGLVGSIAGTLGTPPEWGEDAPKLN